MHNGYTEDHTKGTYTFTMICTDCGGTTLITVNGPDLFRYNNGELIQVAFPYLSPSDRELLKTKQCGECFNKMLGWVTP
jgi:hypothetical protein